MSYETASNGKLDSLALPVNRPGHVGSMRVKAKKQGPLSTSHPRMFSLAMVAKQIFIFPPELRGAVEGSVVDAQPGTATPSRMTNGSVSLRRAAKSHSRMTNGVVQKGSGTTLVVRYQDGVQTISVPANVAVVGIVPGEVQLAAGETAYAATDKRPNGALITHMILVLGGPRSGNAR